MYVLLKYPSYLSGEIEPVAMQVTVLFNFLSNCYLWKLQCLENIRATLLYFGYLSFIILLINRYFRRLWMMMLCYGQTRETHFSIQWGEEF